MTDDLISRKAALELLGEPHPLDHNAVADVQKIIALPAVEAVPLDKLCEWLARNAFAFECNDCEEYCRAMLECDNEVGRNPEYWKNKLTKWMEET